MSRPREPIDLIIAKGKKHLTKDEIEQRRSEELKVPFTDVQVPEYLTEKQKKEFVELSSKLLDLNIFTELDVDMLTRYIIAKSLYLTYTNKLLRETARDNYEEMAKLQTLQDKAFKQCHSCGSALGLSITSRCKLIIPAAPDDEDDEL